MKNIFFIFIAIFSLALTAPCLADMEETFDASLATHENVDGTHYFPQRFVFNESKCLTTITTLTKYPNENATFVVATSGTASPLLWHGKTTTTYPGNPTLTLNINYASTTLGDPAICVFAGAVNRLFTTNQIHTMFASGSSTYTNAFHYDELGYSVNTYQFGSPAQPYDMWINFDGYDITGSPVTAITWYATPTSTCDFYAWDTITTLGQADVDLYGAQLAPVVAWGNSPDYEFMADTVSLIEGDVNLFTKTVAGHGGIIKNTPLVPGQTFYATPHVVSNITTVRDRGYVVDADIVASGATWEFIITGLPNQNGCSAIKSYYPDFSWPFVSTTLAENPYDQDWCVGLPDSTFTEQVYKAMCQAVQFMFKPETSDVQKFATLQTLVQDKPPFGYFTVYQAGFNNFVTTTSSTVDTSTVDLSGITFFATIRSVLIWLFWLVFGGYIIWRFKHFIL